MAAVSLMVLYEDESVEVRYCDGFCLQLSPCGCEFLFEKTPHPSAHPLQQYERIRQRTQFVISSYKEQLVQALEFRNRFATVPYLPTVLIPTNNKTHLFIDISEVKWPKHDANGVTFTDNDGVKVTSCDGNAFLYLAPSRHEFSVEFLCKASQTPANKMKPSGTLIKENQENTHSDGPDYCASSKGTNPHSNPHNGNKELSEPSTKHEYVYTWVVQHQSVSSCLACWNYPLSLALKCSKNKESVDGAKQMSDEPLKTKNVRVPPPGEDTLQNEVSILPKALPLSCPAPHSHRWAFKDLVSQDDQEIEQFLRTELVKIVWCQGIVYRLIHGAISGVEIYPGDGTVIRSQGPVANYFKHYLAKGPAEQKEKMYVMSSLPPDVPGQSYSVRSVLTRASRILQCCHQARLLLKMSYNICCWKTESISSVQNNSPPVLLKEASIPNIGHFTAFSDGKVHVIYCDGVTLHMMWNLKVKTQNHEAEMQFSPGDEGAATLEWCKLMLPDGQCQLVQLQSPGLYERYVSIAVNWCKWLNQNPQKSGDLCKDFQPANPSDDWSVVAELQKIKRFNYLLENSGILKSTSVGGHKFCCNSDNIDSIEDLHSPEKNIAEALERTSKAIQDIELLLSTRISRRQ
ncbi:uncharacterized protein C5orf34 homolog [Polyodon spathula]|uniref:uncharacterized protein C5orf34 homolog n=1 Tax=Polyodon spathula TaxID=7913 RepID=UPI001B7F3E4A|nr:uncharacterized protein C5orf34 homolog [Polyodon spathula]